MDGEGEESTLRLEQLVEALPAFVTVLDGSGKIVFWNARLEEVTGFSRQEMLGRSGEQMVRAGADVRLPLKSGGHRLVRWQLRPLAGGSSALSCALGVDVSQERDALRRTLQSERLAAVGTLAAGLAHELRNPVNSAILQLKVLEGRLRRGEIDPASLAPVLGLVKDEVLRIDDLLGDFLDFARPEPLTFERVDLNALLAGMADALRREIGSAPIAVETDLDPTVGEVELDPRRLRQAVSNLLKNSREALGNSGRIRLRSRAADESGFVEVQVEDDGPGFPSGAPILDAFYTTKPAGTGLGLPIAHSVVRDHGGTLHASSNAGLTRFALRLPQHSR
jgi:signal transduction histidine kinase